MVAFVYGVLSTSVELLAVNIMLHVSGLTRKARALAGGGLFAHEGTSNKNAAAADHVMSILTALQVVYACEGGSRRRVHCDMTNMCKSRAHSRSHYLLGCM